MKDAFEAFDAERAWTYLKKFDGATRRRGENCFQKGGVTMLQAKPYGFRATVQGTQAHTVDLFVDESEGWAGECTCTREVDCEHVYALMKTVIAEHSLAAVRGFSAGTLSPRGKGPLSDQARRGQPQAGGFAREVASALGRRLTKAETDYLRKVEQVYQRCRIGQQVRPWDFDELGLNLGGHGWDALSIWPSFPDSEREFWLYVANAVVEAGRPIPGFLEPVTDLAVVRERLARWRRGKEVERWKNALSSMAVASATSGATAQGSIDLRLVLRPQEALVEWKGPGQAHFESLKTTQSQRLAEDYRNGIAQMTPEAERIWAIVVPRVYYGRSMQFRYGDVESKAILGRLLRASGLESRIVTDAGDVFRRAPDPVRWEVAPAANDGDDYRIRLVQGDGRPLQGLLCSVSGHPPLYLTGDTIYTGPPALDGLLDAGRENVVPAPAIETSEGLHLLQALEIELPPRLRGRVRHVPMHVSIRCALRPTHPNSPTENCHIRVSAEAADRSRRETWDGMGWHEATVGTGRRRARPDEGMIVLYDRSAMEGVAGLVEPLGVRPDSDSGSLTVRVSKKFPSVFVPWLKSLPPHIRVSLEGDLGTLTQEAVSGRVRLDVTEAEIDWFDLRVVLDVSDTTLTPEELKLLLDAKGSFVRLKGKGWRRLEFDVSESEDEKLASLGLNPHQLTAEPQRLHALQLADQAARSFLPEAQVEQIQRRAREIKARLTPALPEGVTATLRPYQLEGFHFLAYLAVNHFGGILADDMGLGKTLQALAWLVWLRAEALAATLPSSGPAPADGVGKADAGLAVPADPSMGLASLVVCPKSVMDNWEAEAARFAPGLRVKAWPAGELGTFLERRAEADLHVINYSQLRIVGEALAPVLWQAVILDEGQYIKNPSSQTAQVARSLRARHRLVLSGTPIENRLLDLWSLMAFAMPGVLSSRSQFARLYGGKDDPLARRRLAARVRPFLIRRTKNQVAQDLPDRVEEDLYCEIEGEQEMLYRAELKSARQLLLKVKTPKELAEFQFNFLASLLRLRQVCCHPALVKPDSKAESAKVTALIEQLEPLMEEGHKVLVFSQFVQLLGLLKPVLSARQWPLYCLTGGTENRGELVAEFQSRAGAAVFLISLKAGGFGLNLTAASYVVLFDPWWNPAVESQAIDRTHRIGQTNKVIAYRLLIKHSIEEKIRALQRQKKLLAEDVLGEEKFARSLTLEDLQFLLSD